MTLPELIALLTKIGQGGQRNAEFSIKLPIFAESRTRIELKFVLKDWNIHFVQTCPAKEDT